MIKQIKTKCPIFEQQALVSFDIINCSDLSQEKYCFSLINKCSIVKDICKNCPHKILIGQEVNKQKEII